MSLRVYDPWRTRREWSAGVATAAVALLGRAAPAQTNPPVSQTAPPVGAPAAAPAASTPEQKLQKAYADVRETSQRLATMDVPMDVEPAFVFRP